MKDLVQVKENGVCVEIGGKTIRLVAGKFRLCVDSFRNSKKNSEQDGRLENFFRFQIFPEVNIEEVAKKPTEIIKELTSLKCFLCRSNLLRPSEELIESRCHTVLSLPENEMDELADNFFCHLLGTCGHGHACLGKKHAAIRESLNPMRETLRSLRRSVLAGPTLFVLNENHLNLGYITVSKEDSLDVFCANCSNSIGYKEKRRPNDYFIWKSSTVLADASTISMELLNSLSAGRYLLESRNNKTKRLIVHVLGSGVRYRHFRYEMNELTNIEVELGGLLIADKQQKVMFKSGVGNEEAQELSNDYNVSHFQVSAEHLAFMVEILNESNRQMCPSMQNATNGFLFALI